MQFSTKKMGVNFFFEKMPNWGGSEGSLAKDQTFSGFFFATFPNLHSAHCMCNTPAIIDTSMWWEKSQSAQDNRTKPTLNNPSDVIIVSYPDILSLITSGSQCSLWYFLGYKTIYRQSRQNWFPRVVFMSGVSLNDHMTAWVRHVNVLLGLGLVHFLAHLAWVS